MGTDHHEPSSDSVDPELDIDRAMMMKAHPEKFQATAPSNRHLGLTKPKAKKPPHASLLLLLLLLPLPLRRTP